MFPSCDTSICQTSQRCITVNTVNTPCPIMLSSPSTDNSSLLPQTILSFNVSVNVTTTESNTKIDTLDTSNFITFISLTEHSTSTTNIITTGIIRQSTQNSLNTIQSTSSMAIDITQTTSEVSQDNIYISKSTLYMSQNAVNTTQNIVEFGDNNPSTIITISVTVVILAIILITIATFVILSLVIIVKRHRQFEPSKCTFLSVQSYIVHYNTF